MPSARWRAVTSAALPAPNGTVISIGLVGKLRKRLGRIEPHAINAKARAATQRIACMVTQLLTTRPAACPLGVISRCASFGDKPAGRTAQGQLPPSLARRSTASGAPSSRARSYHLRARARSGTMPCACRRCEARQGRRSPRAEALPLPARRLPRARRSPAPPRRCRRQNTPPRGPAGARRAPSPLGVSGARRGLRPAAAAGVGGGSCSEARALLRGLGESPFGRWRSVARARPPARSWPRRAACRRPRQG